MTAEREAEKKMAEAAIRAMAALSPPVTEPEAVLMAEVHKMLGILNTRSQILAFACPNDPLIRHAVKFMVEATIPFEIALDAKLEAHKKQKKARESGP